MILLQSNRNFLNQIEESGQLNDLPTVIYYYFEDYQRV